MKTIMLAWIIAATIAGAAIEECGKGFFPVIVMVVDARSGTPVKGAMVRLEGAGEYTETEIDPNRQTKVLPESLGKPVATNAEGVSVVFFYGGWSNRIIDDKSTYMAPMVGTIVVEHDNKEIFRSTLKDWAEKNHFKMEPHSVPLIIVSPTPAK